jgi:predicted glycosyltransferase
MTELRARGHDVVVTARDKDVAVDLLETFEIEHTVLSTQRQGSVNLARELASRTYKLTRFANARDVDAMIGLMGPSIAPASRLLRIPSFVLYDTEIASRTNTWVYPMATEVITPDCYTGPVRGTHVTYKGYHELAYLHPARFTPDPSRIGAFGLERERPYVLIRLPSFASSHDSKESSTSSQAWMSWIRSVSQSHQVVISSERELAPDLEPYRLTGPTADIHHVTTFADVVIGESATMAAEAAVLGTPAILIGATSRGYIDDIERRYGLIRYFEPHQFDEAIGAARRTLDQRSDSRFAEAHDRLVRDHIDVTSWLTDHLVAATAGGGA